MGSILVLKNHEYDEILNDDFQQLMYLAACLTQAQRVYEHYHEQTLTGQDRHPPNFPIWWKVCNSYDSSLVRFLEMMLATLGSKIKKDRTWIEAS